MKYSAGILLFRSRESRLEVRLVHPGDPRSKNQDEGNWSIPKGEFLPGQDPLTAARRELREETGFEVDGPFIPLRAFKQRADKAVYAWAVHGDLDAKNIRSNMFSLEWPPRSNLRKTFPEVDRAEWLILSRAHEKIVPGQRPLLVELIQLLPE